MKKLLTILLLFPFFVLAQTVDSRHLQVVNTIAELKQKPVLAGNVVLVVGLSTMMDGNGAAYFWDAASTDLEDLVYYNVVASSVSTTGRYRRVNVRTIQLPHGTLTMNSGVKCFYASSATTASSTTTTYLTYDGTATGTAIFSSIFYNAAQATVNVTNLVDAVSSCVKSVSADRKTTVHQFWKGNNTVISLLGTVAQSFANAPTGTPVQIKVEGI